MARENWASLKDMDLRLTVSSRRVAPDHATEFGAFEQSWRDSSGVRRTEYGRDVAFPLRQQGGRRRVGRFFGVQGSTPPPGLGVRPHIQMSPPPLRLAAPRPREPP